MSQETLFDTGGPPKAKLDRRPVSAREWECIEAGLEEFNRLAESRLGALRGDGRLSDAAVRIGMRARQWPDLSPEDFRMIVNRGFARPWWRGRPTPGVIFNPGLFESLIAQPGEPRGSDFDEYLRTLEREDPGVVDGHAVEV